MDVVDAIVAELIVRGTDQYEANFNRATAAHDKFLKSTRSLKTTTFDLNAEAQKYKQGANSIAQSGEQADQRATRSRKAKADASVAQDEREVRSAKAAAKAKADAEIAEAQRSARIREAVERGVSRSRITPGSGRNIGATVPREGTAQPNIPSSYLAGGAAAAVSAEAEVNHLMADRFDIQQRLRVATGEEKRALQDQLDYLRRLNAYKAAGLAEDEAIVRAEREALAIQTARSARERQTLVSSAGRFAEGAGVRRFGGGGAAVAGLATAVGVGVGVEVIQSALDYGKALQNLSEQLGITVEDLQAYQKIARDTGVTQEQLTSAFGQFASNLGRAQQNEQEQVKIFKALGVNVRDFASAGDALPTVIDRISQIQDPAQRAAVETRLFGESGRRLDALLSGGAERVSDLARSLQETGRALSAKEIQELDDTARKLAAVKAELQVDYARVVAGNAQAITTLANSFSFLIDRVLKAVDALRIFRQNRDNPEKAIREAQMLTPEGRQALLRQNSQRLRENERAFANGGGISINGQSAAGDPALTQALRNQRRQILADRRAILEYGQGGNTGATTPPVAPGSVNSNLLANLGTPKPPKGKSAEKLAEEAENRTRQFNDQLAAAQADLLRAQERMTGSVERRAEIELQLLETAHQNRLADIESQKKRNILNKADAALEEARAAELVAAENAAYAADRRAIEQDKQLDLARALTNATQTALEAENAILSVQSGLAKTAAERRDIELRLLANQKEQERNRLNGIIAASRPGDPAAEDARAQLGTLDRRYDAQAEGVRANTRGPLQTYLEQLPRTAEQVDEALQNAAVHGLQALDDGLTDAVGKFLHLNGLAGDFLKQLIKIGIQREIVGPIADALFPGGGSIGHLLGFAEGGSFTVGGRGGIDRNVLSINGRPTVRVSNGETVAVIPPNVSASNQRVSTPANHVTIIAPQQFDLSNVVMSEDLITQMDARNRQYANAVAARAGQAAVSAAPARIQQIQTLGN